MAKLIDILARELKVWPETADWAVSVLSSGAPFVTFGSGEHPDQDQADRHTHTWTTGNGAGSWEIFSRRSISSLPCDRLTSIITRAEWQAAVDALNAPKVVEWDGEGNPPAGSKCQIRHSGWAAGRWAAADIKYISSEYLIIGYGDFKREQHFHMPDIQFRPIRTAEQVAADEREKAIADMMEVTSDGISCIGQDDALALYKAGYRKQ